MINFKEEEERYQQILLIKSVLADFRAYDVIRQAHIDLMYHFNIFFNPIQEVSLDLTKVKINSVGIGYVKLYDEIAHIITCLSFVIEDYLITEIPEEELLLLELLGKVNVEITEAQPSKITKSIFCPNQLPSDDFPF